MGGSANYGAMVDAFNDAMEAADINNPLRLAQWCAQLGHESVGLQIMVELWGPTKDQLTYDGRMGNGPGEGYLYRGRGPIQLTGKNNYTAFSRWCADRGFTNDADLFVRNPDLVSEYKWGFLAASWYWTVARPQMNSLCDAGDLTGVTKAINGGTNGIEDRRARYERCLNLFATERAEPVRVLLDYSRAYVKQDTYYNCGPASSQTIIYGATGNVVQESELAQRLGTTVNGTDYIGYFPKVLDNYIPGANYRHVDMPQDPPSAEQKEALWNDIVRSINAGFGVVANIVAPPSNYPKVSFESTEQVHYSGGTVYHYVAVMGYATDDLGVKHVWIADSGFDVTGYWITHDQLSTLIPPKGYAFADNEPREEFGVDQSVRDAALNDAKIAAQNAENEIKALKAMIEKLLHFNRIMLDQLVGPEKDENDNPVFSGWPPNEAENFAGTDGQTLVEMVANFIADKEKK